MNIEQVLRIADLNARYADAIDSGRLEAWPEFFLDDACYRINTAENAEQDLPLAIIYTTSRAMLRDRVKALREANVYEGQRYRHVLGMPLVGMPPIEGAGSGTGVAGGGGEGGGGGGATGGGAVARGTAGAGVRARTNFMVARVMRSRETVLFATGRYEDRIVFDGATAMFAEKTVIIDSRQVDTLLAIPL
jgi:3-phenylpropionate/cinnamic acid dioxygenase small subunit